MRYKRFCSLPAMILSAVMLAACAATGDEFLRTGKAEYINGNYNTALDNFAKAEDRGVKSYKVAELYCNMGNCCYQLKDYDKCIEYQLKCLDVNPEYFEGWVTLGVAYRQTGEPDKAMTCYEVALNYDPEDKTSAQLYTSLGAVYIERGKPISALTYLEKARKIWYEGQEGATVYAYLAIAYKMALEPEKSAEAFEMAKTLGYPKIGEIQEQLDKVGSAE